ncbi:DUF3734 domain-containing protein [Paucibacter oligotrophus]|uniref:DUF3734 domain-containing protein n=1 Tax=Roseateles oligotrophus TaxID=1769250 RepID=A0ABT2YGF9_9BURK|nr:DUF3734 domain-containing protein [Roseateles oligotrophus]
MRRVGRCRDLIYRSKHYETQSKDVEFSRFPMNEHWHAGHADRAQTLHSPRWLEREHREHGVHVYDLSEAPDPTIARR